MTQYHLTPGHLDDVLTELGPDGQLVVTPDGVVRPLSESGEYPAVRRDHWPTPPFDGPVW